MPIKSCCRTNFLIGLVSLFSFFLALTFIVPHALAATRIVSWTPNTEPDLGGYTLFWRTQSEIYTNSKDVGNRTSWHLDDLLEGETYYVAVKAYDMSLKFSELSDEVPFTIPYSDEDYPRTNPAININFQPVSAPVPEGYVVDSGQVFEDSLGYGWTQGPPPYGAWDHNSDLSPDQTYDTIIYVSPDTAWELAVPNGIFAVTVCIGDPVWLFGIESVQVENTPVVDNERLSQDIRWIERDITVEVLDNRLTLTFNESKPIVPLCWIRIEALMFF